MCEISVCGSWFGDSAILVGMVDGSSPWEAGLMVVCTLGLWHKGEAVGAIYGKWGFSFESTSDARSCNAES